MTSTLYAAISDVLDLWGQAKIHSTSMLYAKDVAGKFAKLNQALSVEHRESTVEHRLHMELEDVQRELREFKEMLSLKD